MIIKYIILGDDIRHEAGNKFSLMGILGSSVEIDANRIPKGADAGLSLACIVGVENTNQNNDPKDFSMIVSFLLGDSKIGEMTGQIQVSGVGKIFHLTVPRFQISVKESSSFLVSVRIEKDGKTVTESSTNLDIAFRK